MKPIYSVALSLSQGASAPRAEAVLGYLDDTIRRTLHLSWDLPHAVNADGDEGEWLYAVLSRIVQDYDDHNVNKAVYEPITTFEGEAHVEA